MFLLKKCSDALITKDNPQTPKHLQERAERTLWYLCWARTVQLKKLAQINDDLLPCVWFD